MSVINRFVIWNEELVPVTHELISGGQLVTVTTSSSTGPSAPGGKYGTSTYDSAVFAP